MLNKFEQIKTVVLGKKYDLSFAFISESEIQELNRIYRGKNKPTDILSFPLSKSSGQIVICKSEARRMSKLYDRKPQNFLYFLFIHGLLHLKGYDHGDIMEREEAKFRQKFGI